VLLDVILELPLPIPRELQGYLFPIRSLGMGAKVTDGALNQCLIPLRDDKVMPKKGEALWQRDIRCQPTRRADPELKEVGSSFARRANVGRHKNSEDVAILRLLEHKVDKFTANLATLTRARGEIVSELGSGGQSLSSWPALLKARSA
jgi:hypothetical protein